ncbi:50S ribosomal protein L32 [candidate division WOR-1 bacterium RIFCSPHIGHO2_02_FULL_53_26]|nr:MAG: 50S ribosomal protein L32 [candidate division WOR-1 bacterium RIFCSPHIGHO2_02_FULL_53_26]
MPVPKGRHSNIRQGKRRFSNYRLKGTNLSKCPNCGSATLPHQVCPACGQFKGRQVIKLKEKKEKGKKG